MRKFWALTRVNLQMALYQLSLIRRRGDRKESRGFQVGLLVLAVAIMAYWAFVTHSMLLSFSEVHLPWLVLVFGVLMISFLVLGLGLYTFNSLLFESADTDQLFAYPLPKLTVVLGKVSGIVVENWAIAFVFWLPTVVVYGVDASPGVVFYLFAVVVWLVAPGVPLFVLALVSYLVGLLASGRRGRRILQVVLTVGFLAGIGVGLQQAVTAMMATARISPGADLTGQLLAMMRGFYPPAGYAVDALVTGSWGALGLAVVWNVVPFVLIAWAISASYSWIRSRLTAVARVRGGQLKYAGRSAGGALYRKELGRLMGSPMYMMNSLIGAALTILFAFLFGISTGKNAEGMRELIQQLGITLTPILLVAFLFMLSISNTTAASISLEGTNLWILQSLPVDARAVLRAKLLVQATIIPPVVVVSSAIAVFTVGIGWDGFVMVLVPCVVFTLVSACVGLIYNLHFHRFDFFNDQQVVKNSASVMLTMGTMVVAMMAATFGYGLVAQFGAVNLWAYWGLWVVVLAAAAVVLYRHLMTRGAVLFQHLSA